MIDERSLELIHAEIDGELADTDRAELSRVLLANPDARAFRDRLKQLNDVLDRVGSVDPPPGLAEAVLASVEARLGPARTRWRFGTTSSRVLRYAAVFAGGLIVSALAFQFGRGSGSLDVSTDVSTLVGTMANSHGPAQPSPVDRIEVDLEQVAGAVTLYEVGTKRVLELDLAARRPVSIVAVQQGREMRIDLPAGTRDDGEHVFWVLAPDTARAPVELRFVAAGTLIHTVTVGSRPPQRSG